MEDFKPYSLPRICAKCSTREGTGFWEVKSSLTDNYLVVQKTRTYRLRVPICDECRAFLFAMQRRRILIYVVCLAIGLLVSPAIAVATTHSFPNADTLTGLEVVGTMGGLLLGYAYSQATVAKHLDLGSFDGKCFTFTNPEFHRQFMLLNPTTTAQRAGVASDPPSPVATYLQVSRQHALAARFEEAALALEEGWYAFPGCGPSMAGYPRQTLLAQSEPVSGYAFLVDTCAKAGRRDLAVRFLERMLDLAPLQAGHACQAARAAHISKEAKRMCKKRGIKWSWWQYSPTPDGEPIAARPSPRSTAESVAPPRPEGDHTRVCSRPTTSRGSSNVIGIDLGTTNSVAAMVLDGKPTVIASAEGGRLFPSVVAVNPKTGERMVGEVARRQAVMNPENTIFSAKRLMGRKFSDPEVQTMLRQVPFKVTAAPNGDARVWMGNKEYSPAEISAMILQKLRTDAEALLGHQINQAVITVPAYFDGNQRQATKIAGHIAGLEVLRIINEPTAASLAYGLDMMGDETIAVYHLGGGTFDISILDIGNGFFRMRAISGDTFLGGDDWDWRVNDWVADQFNKAQRIELRHDAQALGRLGEACEKAKVELSTVMETEINLPFITADASGPKHLQMKLTRAKLEQLTEDLIQRTIAPCEKALADAKLRVCDIHRVILVGGMTRMPAIQQRVAQFFGKEPCRGVDPDEVVGVGAGIQAGVLGGAVKDVLLVDATPLTLSVETVGGVATPLVERNTAIPAHRSEVFSTASDNQTHVEIHVVQGERPMAADNRSLAKVIVDAIPPAPRGIPQIVVTFNVDADSTLNVSALDRGTGREQSVRVIPSGGLSVQEVERMVREAEQYRKQDRERREEAEVRHDADNAVYGAERFLSEREDDLPADLRSEAEAKVGELRSALKGNDTDTMRKRTDELGRVLTQIGAAKNEAIGLGSSSLPGVEHPCASEEHPNEGKPQETDETRLAGG